MPSRQIFPRRNNKSQAIIVLLSTDVQVPGTVQLFKILQVLRTGGEGVKTKTKHMPTSLD